VTGFGRGAIPEDQRRRGWEYDALPDAEKLALGQALLDEFGARNVRRPNDDGEIIHSCCIPNSGHRNGDRNPSASFNFKTLTYNCLGCGSQGGLLWFIGVCRNLDSDEARVWLSKQSGLGRTAMDLSDLLSYLTNLYQREERREQIPKFDATMLDPWLGWDFPHPYLTESGIIPGTKIWGRGIDRATIEHFRVGYADEYFDGTERIIIPVFWRGSLVGWQARCLPGYDGSDKYRNSPDFPRDQVLYNEPLSRDVGIVVESPMSVLRHYHHKPNMVATLGAKVGKRQIGALTAGYTKVILWFDNDEAGWKATHTVAQACQRHIRTLVVESPWAADPADLPDEEVERLMTTCVVPYSVWSPPQKLIKWERN
jgi:hypothetical protein